MDVVGPGGEEFTEKHLNDAKTFTRMRTLALRTKAGAVVIPVDHPSKRHFRVLGGAFGERSVRADAKPTHDECVAYLKSKLEPCKDKFRITSFVLKGETEISTVTGRPVPRDGRRRQTDLLPIFMPITGADYRWYDGVPARARFADQKYIESDLCGRSDATFQPSNEHLGIVIEVIRTHEPDLETFERLYQQSQMAHLVAFYIIPDDDVESQFNRVWPFNNGVDLRITFYLLHGRLFEAATPIPWTDDNKAGRYSQAKRLLNRAKSEAMSIKKMEQLARAGRVF